MLKLEIINGCDFEYDENGKLKYFAMAIPHEHHHAHHIYYDNKGRVVKLVNKWAFKTPNAPDVYTYTYDDADRILSITESYMGRDLSKTVYEYNDGSTTVTYINDNIKHITIANVNNDVIDDTYIYSDGMINHLSREYNYDDKTFIEKIEMINTKLEEDIYETISKYSFENDEVKLIEKIKE